MKLSVDNFSKEDQELAKKINSIDDLIYWKSNNSIFAIDENGKFLNNNLLENEGGLKVALIHLIFGFCLTNMKKQNFRFWLSYKVIRSELIKKGFKGISDQYIHKILQQLVNNDLIERKRPDKSNRWFIYIKDKLRNWMLLWDLQKTKDFSPISTFFKNLCRFFKKKIKPSILMCRRLFLGGSIEIKQKTQITSNNYYKASNDQILDSDSKELSIDEIFDDELIKEMFK